MNVRQLRYFLTVMECGSMKEAAAKLNITPQALSKTIGSLEQDVGRPLFLRSGRGLAPTATAKYLVPRAEKAIRAFEDLEASVQRTRDGKEVLTVCMAYGILSRFSPDFVEHFYQSHPDVLLQLVELTDYPAIEALEKGEAQVAILPSPLDTTRFEGTALFTARHVLIVNKKNPLSKKKAITYQDLAGVPLALKGRSYVMYTENINRFLREGVNPCILLETSDDDLIAGMAEQNLAVGVSLDYIAERDKRPGTVIVPFADPTCARTAYLARPIGTVLSGAAADFWQAVLDWFSKEQTPDIH